MAQDSDLCYLTIISKAHLQQFEEFVNSILIYVS